MDLRALTWGSYDRWVAGYPYGRLISMLKASTDQVRPLLAEGFVLPSAEALESVTTTLRERDARARYLWHDFEFLTVWLWLASDWRGLRDAVDLSWSSAFAALRRDAAFEACMAHAGAIASAHAALDDEGRKALVAGLHSDGNDYMARNR